GNEASGAAGRVGTCRRDPRGAREADAEPSARQYACGKRACVDEVVVVDVDDDREEDAGDDRPEPPAPLERLEERIGEQHQSPLGVETELAEEVLERRR